MSFLSFQFAILVAVLLILYYTLFKKNQWLLLLCGSLVFYFYASFYYLIFLCFSIITAYAAGLGMKRVDKQNSDDSKKSSKKKAILTVTLLANVLILAVLKYSGFFLTNISQVINYFGKSVSVTEVNFLLPLGISFYTFMTIGYLLDVYWGVVEPETNVFKYALYILYFPHITQGPIDSYHELRQSLFEEHSFDGNDFRKGLYRILIGLFKKLVIAGRLAVYVDSVYGRPESYSGLTLLTATFFYAFQMYCDFSGYMDIAIGISKLFGIQIAENFNLPYFSKSISEYWRRWHITLGAWLRTYVFYPVIRSNMCKKLSDMIKNRRMKTGSEAGTDDRKKRKALASMVTTIIGLICVWLLVGFWHGASWHYVFHGIYHGTIIIISTILANEYKKWKKFLHISDDSKVFNVFRIVRTFILVDISYILFRADSLKDAGYIIKQIFCHLNINMTEIKNAILPFTEDNTAVSYFLVVFAALAMLITAEVLEYRKSDFLEKHKYLVGSILVLMTALFGVFGQSTFLYAAY